MNALGRIGVLLIVLGFGSLILEQFNYEFRLLSWASDMQPGFGIGVGILGVILVAAAVMMGRKKQAAQAPANNAHPSVGQYGPPPQAYQPQQPQQHANPNQQQPNQQQPNQQRPPQGASLPQANQAQPPYNQQPPAPGQFAPPPQNQPRPPSQ